MSATSLSDLSSLILPDIAPVEARAPARPPSEAAAGPEWQEQVEAQVLDLFARFRGPLLRYAVALGLPAHEGEEIVQEVFLALWRHLLLRRPQDQLRGWMFRVAHNLALRRRQARQRMAASPDELAENQPDRGLNPEQIASMRQRSRRVRAVIAALPLTDRCCLQMRAEGLRYREIASVLGMATGSVSASLARSLRRLAADLPRTTGRRTC